MDAKALQRIERMNYILGGILIAVVAVTCGRAELLGVAVGAALSAINFTFVRRLMVRIFAAKEGDRGGPAMLFLPKMMGLIAVVALAIFLLPLSPAMLAVGFSTFMISIAIETVRFVSGPRGGTDDGADGTSHG